MYISESFMFIFIILLGSCILSLHQGQVGDTLKQTFVEASISAFAKTIPTNYYYYSYYHCYYYCCYYCYYYSYYHCYCYYYSYYYSYYYCCDYCYDCRGSSFGFAKTRGPSVLIAISTNSY